MLLQILMYCRKEISVHKLIVRSRPSRLLSIVMPDHNEDNDYSTPLRVEQIQDNRDAIKFYTGFPSFQLLMACFTFLGPAVSRLSYEDHVKLTKGKPQKLSPLNEFFDVVSSATWFI